MTTRQAKRRRHFTPGSARSARARLDDGAHSWFVRVTKIMLPLLALVIVIYTISRGANDQGGTQVAATPLPEKAAPGRMDLISPKYQGKDTKGRPYTVTADRARRIMGQEEAVALDNPKGDVTLEDGGWIEVQSPQGLYNHAANSLYLSGGVTLFHDKGYELHMKDVAVDLKGRHAHTNYPAEGQGPLGHIEGQTLDVSDGGQLIVFGGPAHLTLWHLSGAKDKEQGDQAGGHPG